MSHPSTSQVLAGVHRDSRTLVQRLQKLQEIGIALSAEQDLGRLLAMILKESRVLTNADSGAIYIRDDDVQTVPNATAKDPITKTTPYLHLRVAQNDSVQFPFKEMKLPFDAKTISGHVAISGEKVNLLDVYDIPKSESFSYSTAFDQVSGYRCKSMLALPMKNRHGDVVGVIQLINKKKDSLTRLDSVQKVDGVVEPFDPVDEELVFSLASQAAVCVEKARLYDDMARMFDGFVESLMLALEKRNRTTYGHCARVAQYALAVARAIDRTYKDVSYTPEQIRELRYAAILHDIGKIAVREAVLDKKHKLTDAEISAIEYRFHYWKERLKARTAPPERLGILDDAVVQIKRINIPMGFTAEDVNILERIRSERFIDVDGQEKPLLSDHEYENLRVPRGNLTPAERREIEEHGLDTWEILKRIPWPRDLRSVPNIASSHHEKINGSGYPWGLKGEDIPLGGKILAIIDIYEALTAKDRPYKPMVPADRALEILEEEVRQGLLDPELFKIFVEKEIYKLFIDETGFIKEGKPKN